MSLDLFAGVAVTDLASALPWYEKLLGAPSFFPDETEAVWELAEHRFLYVDERPADAGHAIQTMFVVDLEDTVGIISGRGLEPTSSETYDNGVRKVLYRDADGNEIGFAGSPRD